MNKKELVDIMKSIALCNAGEDGYEQVCRKCKFDLDEKMCELIRYGEFEKIVEG